MTAKKIEKYHSAPCPTQIPQSLPTRPHRWLVAGQRDTHSPCLQDCTDGRSPVRETHTQSLPTRPHRWPVAGQRDTHSPCLQHRTDGWSLVRETHTVPAYKTAQMPGRRSERHTVPAYKTAQMAGRWSERDTHTHSPCLQDCTDGWSPVRETHTHTSLPTRPH